MLRGKLALLARAGWFDACLRRCLSFDRLIRKLLPERFFYAGQMGLMYEQSRLLEHGVSRAVFFWVVPGQA